MPGVEGTDAVRRDTARLKVVLANLRKGCAAASDDSPALEIVVSLDRNVAGRPGERSRPRQTG